MKRMTLALMLVTAVTGGVGFAQESPDGFKKLNDEFDRVWGEWRRKSIAARREGADEAQLKAIAAEEPTTRYFPRFQEGAKRHAGTDEAIPYLQWVFRWGSRRGSKAAHEALDQLVRDHIDHPSMQRFAFSMALRARRDGFDRNKTLAVQRQIADKASDPKARAETLYWRAYVVAGTPSTDAEKKGALEDLATAIKVGDARTKARAEGLRFDMQRLQIGMVAPDIEGKDLDGVAFKLSDYRGKVVMLDFWGDW